MILARNQLFLLATAVMAALVSPRAALCAAENSSGKSVSALSDEYYKSGTKVLTAFKPLSAATRDSVAVLRAGGARFGLGTIVDAAGFLITKASEIKPGRITATLANGAHYDAVVVATDTGSDIALLKVAARGLKPVQWDPAPAAVGEWIASPGIDSTPEAVGIVSVATRIIPRDKAIMGIRLRKGDGPATIESVNAGFGADAAGLKRGDAIVRINGHPIADYEALTATMTAFRAGETISVEIERNKESIAAEVKLTAEPVVTAAEMQRIGGQPSMVRSERMNRMGTGVSERSKDFAAAIQHDTILEPWQCGGPLVSLTGKAIGINIARAGRVASYALPASLVTDVVRRLMATPSKL